MEIGGWRLEMGESRLDRSWNVFEGVYASMSERLGRSLFEEMTRAESLKPGLTLSKLAAFPFGFGSADCILCLEQTGLLAG